ncbi:TonB-dependent receptor [Erythrobacter sp.]|uniref:TonB-dependent receptor n=1 Tax=Erythrobacter sp. TaxID=1042 RepID=UPI003C71AE78
MIALFSPAYSHAQDVDDEPPQTSATDAGVNTIIVTAQRREENLQDVPLSVTAISREEIREKEISDISRLEQVVPGLRLNRTGSAQRPAIRGVYTEAIGLNSDPRIGFYIDEIYQARPQQLTAALVDLERIEVQKGPQGTLFGRNSYGGNIALTTAAPVDYVEGGVDVIVGNYDRVRAEGFINLPVTDDLALRFAGAIERRDGFLESVVRPEADLQDKDEDFIRGKLRWSPSALDNRLEVTLTGSYFQRGGQGFNAANGKVIGVAVDPSLIVPPGGSVNFNGETYTFPERASGAGGFNGLNLGTGTLFDFTNALRDGIADVNGADIGIPIGGPYSNVYDAQPFEDLEQQQYSAVINYDISDSIQLRSITSFTDFSTRAGGDGDGTPLPLQYFVGGTESEVFTQEFQIQSTDTASPLQYTIGAFYLNEKGRDGSSFYYLNRNYTTETAEALGLPQYFGAGGGIGGSANECQFSFTTPASCSLDFTTGNLFDFRTANQAETDSYAIYAQGSYDLTDQLTLTLGGRYTVDDKQFKTILQSPANGTLFAGEFAAQEGLPGDNAYYAVNPFFSFDFNETCGGFTSQGISTDQSDEVVATVPNYFFTICEEQQFEFFTFRAALDYDISPEHMIYASFNTGAHSGGFGAGVTAANNPGQITTFDTEKVEAYEIGSKNRFFDGRLQVNFAAFFNRFTDLQEQGTQIVSIDGQDRNITTIFNVGGQDTPGAELDVVAAPVPGLTINASVVYLRARYDEFSRFAPPNFICFYISEPSCGSGAFPPTAPQNYGIGGGYFPNAQTNPELFVPTDISGFDFAYVPNDRRVQNTPDWQGQFGATYEIDLGPGAGTLAPGFNTQWTGSYLLSPSAPNIEQEGFTKTDARITWTSENGALSAQAFVLNIEDEATLGRITVRANGEVQGTFADPRTYGVRVGYRF